MIRPKVELGSVVLFAKELSFDFYGDKASFLILVRGEVTYIYSSDEFEVYWVDDDNNELYENVPLRKIHSFEWGGIMVTNGKRDKKLFSRMGL